MAREVIIDIHARFTDEVTSDAKAASKAMEELEKDAEQAAKEVEDLGKTKAKPKVEADTTKAKKDVDKIDDLLDKLNRKTTKTKLTALDKASQIISKVTSKAKAFASKTYSALIKVRDSNVLKTLNNMSNGLKKLTSKTWSAVVKIKDSFTKPLTALKNMLFNVKTLIAGIATAWAAVNFVKKPIALADAYSSAQIGFSTLLGESRGQQMMNDLDEFAKATPFKSSEVISQTQRMLAMGWDAEAIIDDMTTIGDAAAATGKGEQGLQQIVTALAQIKTKGRLSTEELNQLAEAGISAKRYLAEGLGYGSGDEGIAKMTKDLEDGAIASGAALEALLSGMKEYQGMMDKTANETVTGLWSQIEDTFEINIFRRWGQGLQDGAKSAFGSIVKLLDEADGALEEFGDTVYAVGKKISTWLADKLENAVERITEITSTFEFKEATLGGKIKMLWDGVIADPLKEWWDNGGRDKTAETAGKIGSWIGEMLTKGLLALFGATDILDEGVGTDAGSSVAGSFVQGFLDNFDGQAITDAFVDAIGNIWGALPWWAKMLIGGYGAGKLAGGIANFAGGIASFVGGVKTIIGSSGTIAAGGGVVGASGLLGLIGKTGVAGYGASGILGGLANTGYTLLGGTSALSVGGGLAALAGAGGIAGGVAGGAAAIKGGVDLYNAYKAYKAGNKSEAKANAASGGTALAGVATGAAIGSFLGPLGALIGAGVGGVAGWIGGEAWAKKIRAATYESEEMKEAINDSKMSAEELAKVFEKAKWENATKHFGDMKLSLSEIERLADQIVWGDDMGNFEKFSSAVKQAEASLQSMKTAHSNIDRWMWKASLGVKFNEDEIDSIKTSFDEYISAAKAFVENKHYEFTASVSLLVDVESKEGKSIIESGNAFYGKLQEQLNSLGSELSDKVNIALEDGVITLDEQKEITNLQQQIATITQKIANAEQKAEMDLIKIKFGSGNLDYDSFQNLMDQMQVTIDERMTANDDAFVASVSSLNIQLEDGAISKEEYDKQLQTLIDGYTATVENLQAEVKDVELQIIGKAYADELGKDAAADLEKALQYAIDNGIDPVEISDEKMAELLNIKLEGNGETIGNIKDMLSGTLSQLELLEIDGNLMLKIGEVQTDGNVEEKVEGSVPKTVESTVGVNISGEKEIQNAIEVVQEDFGVPKEHAATVAMLLYGDKDILNQVDVSKLAEEFGIPESQAKTIIEKLTGEKSIENKVNVLASDFGIPDVVTKTVQIKVKGYVTTEGNVKMDYASKQAQLFRQSGGGGFARGGIVGGVSAMDSFAQGGTTDNGGIVGGSTRFIRVNEESPEMIIPLSSQRRDRALKLWMKTGELLDVPGFSRGGRSDGGAEEWTHLKTGGSGEASGGQTVHVDIGGITFEIHVDGGDPDSIAEAIKEQMAEIAESVAGILNDAFTGQFENTPARGGAA